MRQALGLAMADARIQQDQIHGLIAVPSLAEPHFMEAHYVATQMNLLPSKSRRIVRTLDSGGAGPIASLLEAKRMILMEGCDVVAVVAGFSQIIRYQVIERVKVIPSRPWTKPRSYHEQIHPANLQASTSPPPSYHTDTTVSHNGIYVSTD